MRPALVPASTIFGSVGATAMALTRWLELVDSCVLARPHCAAPLSVRHSDCPPIHRRCALLGSMTNGVMKRNEELGSPIPDRALLKLMPPSVDFLIDNPVFSTYRMLVLFGSMAT